MKIMPISFSNAKKSVSLNKTNFASKRPFDPDFNQKKPAKYDISNDFISYMAFQEFMKNQNENNDIFDYDDFDEDSNYTSYGPYYP